MESGSKMSKRAIQRTILFGILLKVVVIIASNLILGVVSPTDVAGIWSRYTPSLVADAVVGAMYVFFHMQRLEDAALRADVGAKGGFISSLAIHVITGFLAIFFGLCGTILNLGDPSHEEPLTQLAVNLGNLWFSEYRIVLTSRGTAILIGAMISAISGALVAPLLARTK
ncbi:MAG: hypothetical protein HZB51_18095 [Chloroflexi bacterium]|nr:hypothetical protein [Chloroflexota bacterium]